MIARKLTPQEVAQGFAVCDCGKFAHVMKAAVLAKLPPGYSGELCPECNLWMCSVEKLRECGLMEPAQDPAKLQFYPRPRGSTQVPCDFCGAVNNVNFVDSNGKHYCPSCLIGSPDFKLQMDAQSKQDDPQ